LPEPPVPEPPVPEPPVPEPPVEQQLPDELELPEPLRPDDLPDEFRAFDLPDEVFDDLLPAELPALTEPPRLDDFPEDRVAEALVVLTSARPAMTTKASTEAPNSVQPRR
jgi:hypothetical protein